jgi:hypothetical protein
MTQDGKKCVDADKLVVQDETMCVNSVTEISLLGSKDLSKPGCALKHKRTTDHRL